MKPRPTKCRKCGCTRITFTYSQMYSMGRIDPIANDGTIECPECGDRYRFTEWLWEDEGSTERMLERRVSSAANPCSCPEFCTYHARKVFESQREEIARLKEEIMLGVEDIENRFTYHPPKEGQPELYTKLRDQAKELAHDINKSCPDSREKSLALTKLEETIMWANAAIARHG